MAKFSKKEAVFSGWQTFKNNWRFLLGLTFLVGIFNLGFPILLEFLSQDYLLVTVGLGLIFWLVNLVITVGLVRIYLKLSGGEAACFADLFSCYRLVFRYFLAQILFGVLVVLGLFLLLIPGIIFSLRLSFWPYLMVERNQGVLASLKGSWAITRGEILNLLLFNLVLVFLNFLGLLFLGIGILLTGPVTSLATVFVYRRLTEEAP